MKHETVTKGTGVLTLILVTSLIWAQAALAAGNSTGSDPLTLNEMNPSSVQFDTSRWQKLFSGTDADGNSVLIGITDQGAFELDANGNEVRHLDGSSFSINGSVLTVSSTTSQNTPIRDTVTETELQFRIFRNQLLVFFQSVKQSIHDFLTGDITTVLSETSTQYLGDVATKQTGYSTQHTQSVNGESDSATTLTFKKDGLGGFRVVKQATDSMSRDYGSIVDKQDGKKDTRDDTITSQTTVITRDYDSSGRLQSADGQILNGFTSANGGMVQTEFHGDLNFEVAIGVNQEFLTSQTTDSQEYNYLDVSSTHTVSTLSQEAKDVFGRIGSAQAVATSDTTDLDPNIGDARRSHSVSTTNFVVTDLNSLAAYQTSTHTDSVDLYDPTYNPEDPNSKPVDGTATSSDQTVHIALEGITMGPDGPQRTAGEQVTGRVMGATGDLTSLSQGVKNNGDGTYTVHADTAADPLSRTTATQGHLVFDVAWNNILNTETHLSINDQNFVDGVTTVTNQDVLQSYDNRGVGTTGETTVRSTSDSSGAVEVHYDVATGRYEVVSDPDAANNNATHTESLTRINTEFIAGQFRATDVITSSVSHDLVNNNFSISLTETRQVYNVAGALVYGVDDNADGEYDRVSSIKSLTRSTEGVGVNAIDQAASSLGLHLFDSNGQFLPDAQDQLINFFYNADLSRVSDYDAKKAVLFPPIPQ